jgi:hypothetical protein
MANRRGKIAIVFAIIVVAALMGVTFIMIDEANAQVASSSSGVVIGRPGFDDRFVARRPFINPFLFDDDFFFFEEEEEEFFVEREDFFFNRENFFEREERDD